jgi:hypothetical protein
MHYAAAQPPIRLFSPFHPSFFFFSAYGLGETWKEKQQLTQGNAGYMGCCCPLSVVSSFVISKIVHRYFEWLGCTILFDQSFLSVGVYDWRAYEMAKHPSSKLLIACFSFWLAVVAKVRKMV